MNNTLSDTIDFTILGAGFAGLSMADELLSRGKSVALTDKADPGSGSSGAPLVLINPATGRRAKMVKDVQESLNTIINLLERIQKLAPGSGIFEHNGILRPALDEELAKDFRRSPSKYDWPDDTWIRWLNQEEFSSTYDYFGSHRGGLVVKHGYTVNTHLYVRHLTEYLISRGLIARFNTEATITQRSDDRYDINFPDGSSHISDHVIYATGSAIQNDAAWKFLPFKTTKGQLLDLTFESALPLHESISSMGYFAFMPSEPKRLVVGSTYEHRYDDLQTDEKGKTTLYEKLNRTLPDLSDMPHTATMWSGVRVSTKDHKPVIGEHPLRRKSYLLSGLGSKGMVQGRYLARKLSDHILDGAPIDSTFNLNRFQSF